MKKYKTYIPVIFTILLFITLVVCRNDLVNYLSKKQIYRMAEDKRQAINDTIAQWYDYENNKRNFDYTFLEFGSTGCHSCRQMEQVMEIIRARYPGKVNVVFIHVAEKENQEMVNYYGIATIPTQILLNKNGKEYFRHHGYISADELSKHLE